MSFIKDYQIYTSPLEVPDIFHVFCSLSAIAAAAQRKIWLDMGLFKVAPNLYIILNSPPGKCGKDTAMNVVRELVGEVKAIKTKSDSITKEKIFQDMMAFASQWDLGGGKHLLHSSLTIFASEMSLLIKKGDKDFVSFLNAAFNTSPTLAHSTKHQGENFLINPYLNILGGTTPDWITANIVEDILEGGLSARCLIIHSDHPKPPNPFPEVTPEGAKALERMLIKIESLTQLGGRIQMTPKCREIYGSWYVKHQLTPVKNPKMGGYHYRKRIHLLKVSILISLSEREDLILNEDDMARGLALLNMAEPAIEYSLKAVGRNELSRLGQSILELIKDNKKLTMEELVANTITMVNSSELKEIITSLNAMGSIELVIEDNKQVVKFKEGLLK